MLLSLYRQASERWTTRISGSFGGDSRHHVRDWIPRLFFYDSRNTGVRIRSAQIAIDRWQLVIRIRNGTHWSIQRIAIKISSYAVENPSLSELPWCREALTSQSFQSRQILYVLFKSTLRTDGGNSLPGRIPIGNVYSIVVFGLDYENIEYGYRMDGPFPRKAWFDSSKILLDPYAKGNWRSGYLGSNARLEWYLPLPVLLSTTLTGKMTVL